MNTQPDPAQDSASAAPPPQAGASQPSPQGGASQPPHDGAAVAADRSASTAGTAGPAAAATDASAQLNTQHVKGSVGLKAGSQPPPGGYIVLPVFYIYNSDTIVAGDGHALPGDVDLTAIFAALSIT